MKVPGVEKVIEIPGSGAAGEVRAVGRRGRDRQQHLGRDQGPRSAQDRVGRRPQRILRLAPPSRRRWKRPRASRARSSATRATPKASLGSAAKVVTAEYYQPHMAHAPMEPPVATATVAGGKCEIWAPVQSPYGTREDAAKVLGHADRERDGPRHAARRWLRPQVEVRLRARGCVTSPRRWAERRSRSPGPARTTSRAASSTPPRSSGSRPASTSRGKVVAWRHRSVAPTIMSTFMPDPKLQGGLRARHGPGRRAVRHPQPPLRERRGAGARPDRLVPLRLEHPARASRCSPSWPSSPTSWARTRRTCSSS